MAEKKKNEEDLYAVPKLSPAEQLEIDHPTEEHQLLLPGARVLALWGAEFYAANVCGYIYFYYLSQIKILFIFFRRDGLSRYLIHFVEDNLNRVLPPTGVTPLADVNLDKEVSY